MSDYDRVDADGTADRLADALDVGAGLRRLQAWMGKDVAQQAPDAPATPPVRPAAGTAGAGPGVKAGRTPPRVKENPEYAGFVRRSIRAMGRRVVGHADTGALGDMAALSAELDAAIGEAITGLRVQWGMSWADIGAALGVTRQAAYDRWGKR